MLTDDELRLLWPVLEGLGYPFGPWLQILLLTGQRRDEAARMRWHDLDLVKKLWRIPTTKSGSAHLVPLAPAVVAILESVPRFKGPFVFSTTVGERPISGFSVAKRRLDERLAEVGAIPDWRVHDLRRSVRDRPVAPPDAAAHCRAGA